MRPRPKIDEGPITSVPRSTQSLVMNDPPTDFPTMERSTAPSPATIGEEKLVPAPIRYSPGPQPKAGANWLHAEMIRSSSTPPETRSPPGAKSGTPPAGPPLHPKLEYEASWSKPV